MENLFWDSIDDAYQPIKTLEIPNENTFKAVWKTDKTCDSFLNV